MEFNNPIYILRVSLQFHSPQAVYDFFDKNVGQLYMLLRGRIAFINFVNPNDVLIAQQKFQGSPINGVPLYFKKILEQSFRQNQPKIQKTIIEEMDIEGEDEINWNIIKNKVHVKDEDNQPTKIYKTKNKQILEMVAHNELQTIIQAKTQQLKNKYSQNQQVYFNKLGEFSRFVSKKMENMSLVKYSRDFIQIKKELAQFGNISSIQLDPELPSIYQNTVQLSIDAQICGFSQYSKYLTYKNKSTEIKKIIALSNDTFACTVSYANNNQGPKTGKMSIYSLNQQKLYESVQLGDGCYGLANIGQRFVAGSYAGKMYLFSKNLRQPQLIPKKTNFLIHDIVNVPFNQKNYLTFLSMDNIVRVMQAKQIQIGDGVSTLFFQDLRPIINDKLFQVNNLGLSSLGNGIFSYGLGPKLCIYNIDEQRLTEFETSKQQILCTKKLGQNTILVGNSNYIDIFDRRMNKICKRYAQRNEQIITALQVVNPFYFFYGSGSKKGNLNLVNNGAGNIGLFDLRVEKCALKKRPHRNNITSLCKVGNHIVSGDRNGQMISWNINHANQTNSILNSSISRVQEINLQKQ